MFINQKIVIGIIAAILILIFGFLFLFLGPLRCLSQPFIERIINETPEAKIADYLEAVMENDEGEALEFWQLPDWKECPLLSNRRENITEELLVMDIKDFNIFDIEWWGTCCDSGVISDPQSAGGARVYVKLINRDDVEYIYIFDVFHKETSYWGNALGCPLRHWLIRDIYLSGQKPLFWTLSSEGKASKKEGLPESILPEMTFSKYVNNELGFSIDIPDNKVYGCYRCDPKKVIQVPVKVFEDSESGTVYISQEYYYQSKHDSELHKHVGECKKITYSASEFSEYKHWIMAWVGRKNWTKFVGKWG